MNQTNGLFCCGAECGIAAVGTVSAGTEHWSNVGSAPTPTVVTSGPSPMRSTRAFRMNPSAQPGTNLDHTFSSAIASPGTLVARFYVYFATLPSVDTFIFSSANAAVIFKQSVSEIRLRWTSGGIESTSGVAVTTGQWYRIDVQIVRDTTTTIDAKVDGVDCAQVSVSTSASTITQFRLGPSAVAGGNITCDWYYDDITIAGIAAGAEYPIGEGKVVGLYPNADMNGTEDASNGHIYSATTDFLDGGTAAAALAAATAETDTWQSLQNPLSTTVNNSKFVTNALGSLSEQLSWKYDDLPSDAASINTGMMVAITHSASATTNQFRLNLGKMLPSPSGGGEIIGDLSETTITVPTVVVGFGGSPLTVATANTLFTTFKSNDVNPDVYCDGVCIEIDYVPATAPGPPHRPKGRVQRAQAMHARGRF